ncbi:hypothetical protein MGA5115_02104 [Marinomonas gallaica]|uniref:Uncharacterized protein n=1 Tax=Marinomonas gallaica TaxID=1806667 RepID=A0A1C3JS88_9GAMM|nr:hypothetical protein MGA5115_02104 [Marinomonas gallaica]SBT20714.1 hypothetical protein MGA5116_01301 [Marinomonas gallaica]
MKSGRTREDYALMRDLMRWSRADGREATLRKRIECMNSLFQNIETKRGGWLMKWRLVCKAVPSRSEVLQQADRSSIPDKIGAYEK